MVNQLPYFPEEVVALYYKISKGKPEDMLEVPLGLVLEFMVEIHGGLMELGIGGKKGEILLLKICRFG